MGKRLITPQLAKEWLNTYNTDNYRPLNDAQAELYARDMRNGKWRYIKGQSIKFDINDVLCDGQKRLKAVIFSETDQYFNVETGYDPNDKYYMDLGKPRLLGAMLQNMGFKDANNISASIRLEFDVLVFKQGRNLQTPTNRATFHEVIDAALADETLVFAADSTNTVPKNVMRRSVAIYCYKVLHNIDAYEAAEFFHKLVELDDIDDKKDKAIKELHKRLVYGIWTTRGRAERLQVVATVFRAWNAWRNQEDISRIQKSSGDIKKLVMPEPV